MKYLLNDSYTNNDYIINGENLEEILVKAIKKTLTKDWSDDLMENLENYFDLTFTRLDNLETV